MAAKRARPAAPVPRPQGDGLRAGPDSPGQVITFYSYKGGTGRSMALANVACLLARQTLGRRGVLMIDWDLEAPGLHRFFQQRFKLALGASPRRSATAVDRRPGLIDLFLEFDDLTPDGLTLEAVPTLLRKVRLDRFILKTTEPRLDLLKAGRFDADYAERINTFPWQRLFDRSPDLLAGFTRHLAARYQYILIDSRTGLTDTSGICTTLLPEKLVVVFTPNRQSVTGVIDVARRAITYRRQSDDLRPLGLFPLPSRIEPAEPSLRDRWRFGYRPENRAERVDGYQHLFEDLVAGLYDLDNPSLSAYFDEVQVQHVPRYAYGEEIAVLTEHSADRLSLRRSYESFSERLVKLTGAWEPLAAAGPSSGRDTVPDFDVYFSYELVDRREAGELKDVLEGFGLRVFFDVDDARPGVPYMEILEQAVAKAEVIVICIGRSGFGADQRHELTLLSTPQAYGKHIIPVLLPGAKFPESAPDFLLTRQFVKFAERMQESEPISRLVWGITGQRPDRPADHRRSKS